MTGLALVSSLMFGGAVFFFFKWAQAWRTEAKKTELERRRERIDAETRQMLRQPFGKRIKANLASWGWEGDLAPLFLASSLVYLLVVIVLGVIGLTGVFGAILAFPVSIGAVGLINQSARSRRQRAFGKQLMQALDMFAAQLKGGLSAVRAMEQVLPSLPQPLRGELGQALEQHRASRPLGDALAEVAQRYPSRAMQMLVVAVRIDEERGGKLAGALEQAAENVRRDFELGAEAQAELAQEKAQFFGILAILGVFVVYTISSSGPTQRAAFTSGVGLISLTIVSANVAIGIFRVLNTFKRARGDI